MIRAEIKTLALSVQLIVVDTSYAKTKMKNF